jgi:predicted Zn-dependent peptidase
MLAKNIIGSALKTKGYAKTLTRAMSSQLKEAETYHNAVTAKEQHL